MKPPHHKRTQVRATTEQRIRFRGLKPYFTVDSLDDLQGPEHSTITVPVTILWSSTHSTFDMDNPGHRRQASSALRSHEREPQLRHVVNWQRPVQDWTFPGIDQRIIDLWNARHPQLAGSERELQPTRPPVPTGTVK